jgi:hypothetical protein
VKIEAADYDRLKGFFAWMLEHVPGLSENLQPEDHPVTILTNYEERTPSLARRGLAMAIGDILEQTEDLPKATADEIDCRLTAVGLPSLTEIRIRFWSKIHAILKRARVRSETEYYALRNVVESMPDAERLGAWQLLAEYEERSINKSRARAART